jgi:hypothetical protein
MSGPTWCESRRPKWWLPVPAPFAWDHGLRGYDAVHLAAASVWQAALGERVTLASFDRHLWTVAESVGLDAYPPPPDY